jgi:hypothetical protein
MSPKERNYLKSPDPDERREQDLEELLATSRRLIAELQVLLEQSKKSYQANEALLDEARRSREEIERRKLKRLS